jgi:hypothetical protein
MSRAARLQLFCLLAFGAAMALGACPARADQSRIDISLVIDKATAEATIGEPVKTPSPRNQEGADGYYSKCNYYGVNSRKALILRLYQAGANFDAKKELESVRASTGIAKSVSGLGDKAQIYSGPLSGLPANTVMLYVIKGNSLVTVGLSGLDEEIALDKTKRLAQKIVAQLP